MVLCLVLPYGSRLHPFLRKRPKGTYLQMIIHSYIHSLATLIYILWPLLYIDPLYDNVHL